MLCGGFYGRVSHEVPDDLHCDSPFDEDGCETVAETFEVGPFVESYLSHKSFHAVRNPMKVIGVTVGLGENRGLFTAAPFVSFGISKFQSFATYFAAHISH